MSIKTTLVGVKKFGDMMEKEKKAWRKATLEGVKRTTREIQLDARREVSAAFSGSGLVKGGSRKVANAVRSKIFDDGRRGAAGIIFSKFGRRKTTGFVDYIAPRLFGAVVRPLGGRQWLTIPLTGGKGRTGTARIRGKRLASEGKLSFVPIKGGKMALLVRRTKTRSTPVFLLVRQVRYPRRTTPAALLRPAFTRLPRNISDALRRTA